MASKKNRKMKKNWMSPEVKLLHVQGEIDWDWNLTVFPVDNKRINYYFLM